MQHLQKISRNMTSEAIDNYVEFLLQKKQINAKVQTSKLLATNQSITISEFQKKFPDINWIQEINKQFLKHSRVEESEEIVIVAPQYFEGFYEAATKLNKT